MNASISRFHVWFVAGLMFATAMAVAVPPRAEAASTLISYLVMPHPDDETGVWSLVTGSTDNYKVIIFMTEGEASSACRTAAEGTGGGPYWYQGPSSPVGQPNYAEINPRGTGANLWAGRWTSTCSTARIESTLSFLEAKAAADSTAPGNFPSAGSPSGTFSFSGNTSAGIPPRREDNGNTYTSRTARVYNATNGRGKVIFFNLGDGDLKKEEVRWAIAAVRANKSALGIPNYGERNALGAFRNNVSGIGCDVYDHPDHASIHTALFTYDMIAGRQHGRTCSNDPDVDPTRTASIPLQEHYDLRAMSGNTAVGIFQRRYGWLAATNWSSNFDADHMFARTQYFWSRFS